jgi:hypothetical protein
LVNYKPLKRREDVETSNSLCVDTKWVWHICNHYWEFVDTIRTCFIDGNVHQEENFWQFKITWLLCFDEAIFTTSIAWSSSCRALDGCDENF